MEEDVEIEILYKSNEKLLLEAAKDTDAISITEINQLENKLGRPSSSEEAKSSINPNVQCNRENLAGDLAHHHERTFNELAETEKMKESQSDNYISQILRNQDDKVCNFNQFAIRQNNSLSLNYEELLQKDDCAEGVDDLVNQHIFDVIATDPVKYYLSRHTSYYEQFEDGEDDEDYKSTDEDWDDDLENKDVDFINDMLEQADLKSHIKSQFSGNRTLQKLETKALPPLNILGRMLIKRGTLLSTIEEKLQQLSQEKKCRQKELQDALIETDKTKKVGSSSSRFCFRKFGMPYFSDDKGFYAPPNIDHVQKSENEELMIESMPKANNWSKPHKVLLEKEIKRTLIAENSAKLTKEITKLIDTVKNKDSNDDQTVEKIIKKQNELKGIYKKSLKELVKGENECREFDWMKFSVSLFDGQHSAEECKRFWNLYLKPSINKAAWSESEDLKLTKIASQLNYQDWEKIAYLLGTNRSGFQCFVHYNSRLDERQDFSSGKWTNTEDRKLVSVVNSSKVGNFIPWSKVSSYMGNRNHTQIYNRWANSLNPDLVKGRFSKEEDILIVAGIEVFGVTFKELALFINNRTSSQIRERYERYLLPKTAKVGTWSLEEDEKLLKLVQDYGSNNWSKIAKEMKTRTRTQVRQRYAFIQKMKKKKPGWTVAKVKRRNINGRTISNKTIRDIASIKKVFGEVDKVFHMTDIEKETFMVQKLGELKNKISARPSCNKGQKRKIRSANSEINGKLMDYFKGCYLSTSSESTDDSLNDTDDCLEDIYMITKFLGYALWLPKSEEEVWDRPTLSFDSKCFLHVVINTQERHTQQQLSNLSTQQSCSNSQLAVRKPCPVEKIDCPIPEHDDTIIMNEWWHSPPVNVASLNFSEFFKRTVFDYSNGMHKDIWSSKTKRSQVVNISEDYTLHEEGKSPLLLDENFLPNQFTTLGLRSLLINRVIIEKVASDNFFKEELNEEEDTKVELHLCSQVENNLRTLFTWPTVLSVTKKRRPCRKVHPKKTHGNFPKDLKSYSKASLLKKKSVKSEHAKCNLLENEIAQSEHKKLKVGDGSLHLVKKRQLKNQISSESKCVKKTKKYKTTKENYHLNGQDFS